MLQSSDQACSACVEARRAQSSGMFHAKVISIDAALLTSRRMYDGTLSLVEATFKSKPRSKVDN